MGQETWRDRILGEFVPGGARLTVVADPDGLILDEAVLAELGRRRFDVLIFEDPVSFRYAYESRFRTYWDDGKAVELVVVAKRNELEGLPYDVTEAGRQLRLGLQDIFPKLSRAVVATLGTEHLDRLHEAPVPASSGALGEGATLDFILRHVFGIAAETVREPADLLRVLLRIHHGGRSLPPAMGGRLASILRQSGRFAEWPLDDIVPGRDAFFAFLQERWPFFLDSAAAALDRETETRGATKPDDSAPDDSAPDDSAPPPAPHAPSELRYPGPAELPFGHRDVRVYIDNLFLEGRLRPVPHEAAESFAGGWMAAGVQSPDGPTGTTEAERLKRLVEAAAEAVPGQEARYGEWLRFARTWAKAVALEAATPESGTPDAAEPGTAEAAEPGTPAAPEPRTPAAPEPDLSLAALRPRVDAAFAQWLGRRYAGLANLPPAPPVMLHHVPHVLARHLDEAAHHKAALLVVDGLSMDQWVAVREELTEARPAAYRFDEQAVFAWIPTLTSVSRQAVFAGRPPFYFPPGSIRSTNREPVLWRQLWADRGLAAGAVVYEKKLGDGSLDAVADLVVGSRVRVAGLVVDTVDRMMHGMVLGARGMHGLVRQWARETYLPALLDLLLDNGFRIWLTSDHGNVEATGCGSPPGGAVAAMRGKRAHIYPSPELRKRAAGEFPDARPWPPTSLPSDYLPLLAPARSAFVPEGKRIVGHGGASLEEVVVPLVRIDKADS